MKCVLFFLIFSFGFSAGAVTRAQFVGPYGIIRIVAKDYSGITDTDGQVLFEHMNVPVRDSLIGPGKSIETTDKGLQFICANRGEPLGYECSIFVHRKGPGVVNSAQKLMQYKVEGPEADRYGKLFKVDANGNFLFVSQESSFKVEVKPHYFEVLYYEGGSRPQTHVARVPPEVKRRIVIINIEDTLKVSHVLNFWDSLNYNTDTRKKFLGMEGALRLLRQQDPETQFFYLVQGPELAAGVADRNFLKKNDFPRGRFVEYGRSSLSGERLKILRSLVSLAGPDQVILLSHNGGVDPQVFHNLAQEFSQLDFAQYIHIVYSTSSLTEVAGSLFPQQIGYVTAAELVADWSQKNFTRSAQSLRFSRELVNQVLAFPSEGVLGYEYALPDFVFCDDFQWSWTVDGEYQYLLPLKDYLSNRCYNQKNENKVSSPASL